MKRRWTGELRAANVLLQNQKEAFDWLSPSSAEDVFMRLKGRTIHPLRLYLLPSIGGSGITQLRSIQITCECLRKQ